LEKILKADSGYLDFESKFINRDIFMESDIKKSNQALFKMLDNWIST
ncbi:MAG: hypothetical protein RL154_477, partial [Pseudomonadota bacterium]